MKICGTFSYTIEYEYDLITKRTITKITGPADYQEAYKIIQADIKERLPYYVEMGWIEKDD